jgi:hypothetical protein
MHFDLREVAAPAEHHVGLLWLHLGHALGALVTRMTLIDSIVMSMLLARGEDTAYAENEGAVSALSESFRGSRGGRTLFRGSLEPPGA